jgi:ankyrin repeat protein
MIFMPNQMHLQSAAASGHAKLCKLFIDKGVNVNAFASSGGSALMFAAGAGHLGEHAELTCFDI